MELGVPCPGCGSLELLSTFNTKGSLMVLFSPLTRNYEKEAGGPSGPALSPSPTADHSTLSSSSIFLSESPSKGQDIKQAN